jgi:hypothetical protein
VSEDVQNAISQVITFLQGTFSKKAFFQGKTMEGMEFIFFFDFRKIIGRTKNFKKYTSAAGVKSLPPWGTAAGEHLWHNYGGRPLPPCTWR